MNLVPKKAKTVFYYDCPHCGMEIEVSSKIVESVGKTACEYCDSLISFVPIKVSYKKTYATYKSESPQKQKRKVVKQQKVKKDNPLKEDCVSMLTNLGYLKKDAKKIVDQYFSNNNPKNLDDAIDGILKKTTFK